jgi:RimJ/RimL family protein N-acetyltransferase
MGIATDALSQCLTVLRRAFYTRVAKDNVGSIRVLEKCGFTVRGQEVGFANARAAEIEELVLRRERPR